MKKTRQNSKIVTVMQLVSANLEAHGFRVTEIEEGIFMAQDDTGTNVMLKDVGGGVLLQNGIKTKKLSEEEFGTLFAHLNSFNVGSLITKAYMPPTDFTAVTFDSWFPPVSSDALFEQFFSLYLAECDVHFDKQLRKNLNNVLLR